MLGISLLGTFKLGVRSLMQHKLRAALTMLGVLFGVSSVVAMLAIGEGASFEAQEQIRQLGSTNIILRSVKPSDDRRSSNQSQRVTNYGLTDDDLDRILETLPSVKRVVPIRDLRQEVRVQHRMINPRILATLPSYLEVTGRILSSGRFLCEQDHMEATNVCVLSGEAAQVLFPFDDPLAGIVKIGSEYFRVVGTLVPRTTTIAPTGTSDLVGEVFLPLRTARRWFGQVTTKIRPGSRESELVELHEILAQVGSLESVEPTAEATREVLKRFHPKSDYEVIVPLELLIRARETQRIFNIVLGAIAGISLLVGGIGIMNVMLATVTERTKEIGVRRALGAKKRHIIGQFLVETVVLSASGGILGVLLGILIPTLVEEWTDLKTIVAPTFPMLALGISVLVGVVFGLYPAWKAAELNPVEALRHE